MEERIREFLEKQKIFYQPFSIEETLTKNLK
jgi:hypothetical protein